MTLHTLRFPLGLLIALVVLLYGCASRVTVDSTTNKVKFADCGLSVEMNGVAETLSSVDMNRLSSGLTGNASWRSDGIASVRGDETNVSICTCRSRDLDEQELISMADSVRRAIDGRGTSEKLREIGRAYDFSPRRINDRSQERYRIVASDERRACLLLLIVLEASGTETANSLFQSVRRIQDSSTDLKRLEQLRKLDDLYKTGAISFKDYTTLRDKIIVDQR